MTSSAAPRPQPVWYVQAGGRVWGPYPQGRLADFVDEGRLTPQSLIASQPSGPFGPAERRRELLPMFRPAPATGQSASPDPGVIARDIPRDQPVRRGGQASDQPREETSRERGEAVARVPARAMVVWADLASLTPARFESVLAAYGPYVAIRPGLWLIQARMGPPALRNALSRRLRSDDALLVLQAPLDHTAWFNLAPAAERELRQLWEGQG